MLLVRGSKMKLLFVLLALLCGAMAPVVLGLETGELAVPNEDPLSRFMMDVMFGRRLLTRRMRRNNKWRRNGNEGNEGNEGREGAKGRSNSNRGGGGSGEFVVCLGGANSRYFGPGTPKWRNQPAGLTVYSDGRCVLEEYAGGFDGFPSIKVGDGHEEDLDKAITDMFPGDRGKQNSFLEQLISQAKPANLQFPRDRKKADEYMRMFNVRKLSSACKSLITVKKEC